MADRSPQAELAARWAAESCPMIDGVVFGDGRVKQVFTAWRTGDDGRLGLVIEPGPWTTLQALMRQKTYDWAEFIELCCVDDPARRLRIIGGETGHGSQGFVAAHRSGGEIAWIAAFERSNPFIEVVMDREVAVARTNLGAWWRFPIDAPEQVEIISA